MTKYIAITTVIALASLTVNFYAGQYIISQANAINALKEECSLSNNVHISNCQIKAVDVSEKQGEQTAALLPPPSL